jgi:hypothetical protein
MDRTRSKGSHQETKGTVGRRERMKTRRLDPYEEKKKWPEGTRCTRCGAYVVNGRWSWEHVPAVTGETLCPACRRINDHYPAGILEISGPFAASHMREITRLLRNVEAAEEQEHPLERIMTIEHPNAVLTVETTGIHLARRLGNALDKALNGVLTVEYGEGDEHVRVRWQR